MLTNYKNTILFDGDDDLFKSLVKDVKIYFEYGVGKSTIYMFENTNCSIFGVDTSKFWAQKIKNFSPQNSRLNIQWINVGKVGDWGYPTTFKLRQNFSFYANWFWNKNKRPDLVLVDGRFRIYCFLTTLKLAPEGTKILFDDYTTRPLYHVVEEFIPVYLIASSVNNKRKKL